MTFKTGDRVRCINAATISAPEGSIATVTEDVSVGDRFMYVKWDRSEPEHYQMDGGYYPDIFELVTPKPPKVVRKSLLIEAQPEGGFLVSERPLYIHDEPNRLAAFSALSEALEFMDKAMGH